MPDTDPRTVTGRPEAPPVHLSPGLWEFTKRLLVVALFVGIALLVWYGMHVLLLAFAGVLVAVMLTSLARLVARHTRLAYGWSLAVVVIALLAVLALLGWLLAAQIGAQLTDLAERLPHSLDNYKSYLQESAWGRAVLNESKVDQRELFQRLGGALSVTVDAVAGILVIVFVGLYGAVEPDQYRQGILYLFPAPHRQHTGEVLDAIAVTLERWLAGQFLVMVITGTLVTVGLWLLGMPLALALGLIAFVLEIIPVVGPVLFAIPGVLLALTISPHMALYVVILYLVVQGIESNVLIPLVQKHTVRLPPVLTLLVVTLFWILAGGIGVFLAAPLTAAAMVVVKMLYVKDTLGSTAVQVPGQADGQARQPAPSGTA